MPEKWQLNAKLQKLLGGRDEKERRKAKEELLHTRRNTVKSSRASTLRVHIEASISNSQARSSGTQDSSESVNASQHEEEDVDKKRRKLACKYNFVTYTTQRA